MTSKSQMYRLLILAERTIGMKPTKKEEEFTWYSGWSDVAPFFTELVPVHKSTRILLPGIGNDSSMVDMYDEGFRHMTAFDYAPEGIECATRFFGVDRLLSCGLPDGTPVR